METVQYDSWKLFESALEKYLDFDYNKNDNEWGCLIKSEKKLDQVLQDLKTSLSGRSTGSEIAILGNTKLFREEMFKKWTFLYFSREKWTNIKNKKAEYDEAAKKRDMSKLKAEFFKVYTARIRIGCPKVLCLYVWKSLSKAPLLIWNCDYMIEQHIKLWNLH